MQSKHHRVHFCVGIFIAWMTMLPSPSDAAETVLTAKRYGAIRFGMSLKSAEKALAELAAPNYEGHGCKYVSFKRYSGVRFMVEDGIVTRADIGRSVKNSTKIAVGTTIANAKANYPRIEIGPHKYDDAGHYLVLSTSDNRAAIVFEASKGVVTAIRAGLKPSVEYVEGCL